MSRPRSRQYLTASSLSGALRLKFGAQPRPAATIKGVTPSNAGNFGSAPALTSRRIACTSTASAARQKDVAPVGSTQVLSEGKDRNQTRLLRRALGFAPC